MHAKILAAARAFANGDDVCVSQDSPDPTARFQLVLVPSAITTQTISKQYVMNVPAMASVDNPESVSAMTGGQDQTVEQFSAPTTVQILSFVCPISPLISVFVTQGKVGDRVRFSCV